MKYPVYRFVFGRRGLRKGLGSVELEIYFKGKRKWVATGVTVPAECWSADRGIINHPRETEHNLRLSGVRRPLEDFLMSRMASLSPVEWEDIDLVVEGRKGSHSIKEMWARFVEMRRNMSAATHKRYRMEEKRLGKYSDITTLEEITPDFIRDYDAWMRSREMKVSSIAVSHKTLRLLLSQAVEENLIPVNPYNSFKIENGRQSSRKFLEPEQVQALRDAQGLTGEEEQMRDLFLFQCNTGLSYSEMADFDPGAVVERGGRYIYTALRKKTGTRFYTVLLPEAVKILNHYAGKLPMRGLAHYDFTLKRIAAKAGLNIPLSSHMGRHTAACMFLNGGMPIEVVSRILGHTDIRVTQVYARIMNKTVEKAFDDFLMAQESSKG